MTRTDIMRRAVELSIAKMREGAGGPFGAVIARDGEIVSEGWNRVIETNDPTEHAEIAAIRAACAKIGSFDLSGCVIYASCEPCPMCLGAIHWARLDRIYYAATSEDAEAAGFDDAHFYRELRLSSDARRLSMIRIPDALSGQAFHEWKNKSDKVRY